MKLIEKDDIDHRVVDYYGISLSLLPEEIYIATDADGEVYAFEHEPYADLYKEDEDRQIWRTDGDYRHLGKVDLDGIHWSETLRHYPVVED